MYPFLVLIAWTVGLFFASFLIGRFYFREPNRALVFAIALAATFFVTYNIRSDAQPPEPVVTTGSAPAAAAPETAMVRDVSALCAPSEDAKPAADGVGSVDAVRTASALIADGNSVDPKKAIEIGGWAVDPGKHMVAEAVCVEIDGKMSAKARERYGVTRDDVASALHDQSVAASGFGIEIPPATLAHGAHVLQVIVKTKSGPTWQRLGKPISIVMP